jgi:hypothetical protein
MITIWGRSKAGKEKIDQASNKKEANYLVGEYQMAYGKGWTIWAGKEEDRIGGYIKEQDRMFQSFLK